MFFRLIHIDVMAMSMLMAAVPMTESLLCYQCATSDPNGDCITDYWGMVNSSTIKMEDKDIVDNRYSKNCTDDKPSWNRCMIETQEQDGKTTHYHRGCHDGRTFSEKFDSPRFHNITPTNHTVCAFTIRLTCYRFCDQDFCNGPQKPPEKTDLCEDLNPYSENATCGVGGVYFDSGPIRNPFLLVGVVTAVLISLIGRQS